MSIFEQRNEPFKPCVMLFKSNSCGHCRAIAEPWKQLCNDPTLTNKIHFITYDHIDNKSDFNKYNITRVPTILLTTENNIYIHDGSKDFLSIKKFINTYITDNKPVSTLIDTSDSKPDMMLFKSDGCGHCEHFKKTWEMLNTIPVMMDKINFITLDAEKDKEDFEKYKINGYPTLLLNDKSNGKIYEYNGDRDIESLQVFINEYTTIPIVKPKFMLFKSKNCGHCKIFKKIWNQICGIQSLSNKIDFEAYDSKINSNDFNKFNINKFPTLLLIINNETFEYTGTRNMQEIQMFLNEKLSKYLQ